MDRSGAASVKVWKYVLVGAAIGTAAGVAEAMIAAPGEARYGRMVRIYWGRFGFAGWAFGAAGGCLLARRIRRRRARRAARRLLTRRGRG